MFRKDVQLMKGFRGWAVEQMRSLKSPALIINGTQDVGSVEHAVEMYRIIADCELAILPGKHGEYLGALEALSDVDGLEYCSAALIERFLDKKG